MGSPNPAQALGLLRQDLETALDHIRGLLVAMHTADDLNRILNGDLIRTFRALGIPIESASLSVPADEAAYFVDAKHALLEARLSDIDYIPIAKYPWVGESWQSGEPVLICGDRLAAADLRPDLTCLVEIPLVTGGSMGIGTTTWDTFDLDAIQREYLDIVRGSAESLLDILNDIIDLSKNRSRSPRTRVGRLAVAPNPGRRGAADRDQSPAKTHRTDFQLPLRSAGSRQRRSGAPEASAGQSAQ